MDSGQTVDRINQFVIKLNEGEVESVRKYFAREFFTYVPEFGEPTAAEVFYDFFSDIKTAFSDLHLTVQELRPEGKLIKGTAYMEGVNDGSLWGAPPSYNHVAWSFDIAVKSYGDQFAVNLENLALPEVMAVMRQIDLVPPPDKMDQPSRHPVVFPEILLKVLFTGQVGDKACSHLDMIYVTEPAIHSCQACHSTGDIWPALRMCLVCGFVGCCDTSKNKHMKQHYEETGHPIFRSIRMDEGWVWCYEDSAFFSKRILEKA